MNLRRTVSVCGDFHNAFDMGRWKRFDLYLFSLAALLCLIFLGMWARRKAVGYAGTLCGPFAGYAPVRTYAIRRAA